MSAGTKEIYIYIYILVTYLGASNQAGQGSDLSPPLTEVSLAPPLSSWILHSGFKRETSFYVTHLQTKKMHLAKSEPRFVAMVSIMVNCVLGVYVFIRAKYLQGFEH